MGDCFALLRTMEAGLSPSPCNAYGESLVHLICRRGDADMLQVMLDMGTDIAVADDFGRTLLHDACWAANRFGRYN